MVEAAEIDAFAGEAIVLNAAANGVAERISVTLGDIVGEDRGWDTVLAGDICYERSVAEAVTAWLKNLAERGATVLIGDPGRTYLPRGDLEEIATYQVPTNGSWRISRSSAAASGGSGYESVASRRAASSSACRVR